MATNKAAKKTKASGRNKKLSNGKKMNEVKPLSYQYYVSIKGNKQG